MNGLKALVMLLVMASCDQTKKDNAPWVSLFDGGHPMDGSVHIDEFVLGGREEGKVGRSYDSKKKKAVCAPIHG